ncbi:MAG: type IV toxin-antitoxin system AbiEi family antitoxin domain-containing protein [Nostocoides sp.]
MTTTHACASMLPSDLVALADGQGGLFTTGQAQSAGVFERQLTELARHRAVVRLNRGLYAVAWSIPTRPEERHLQLAAGAQLLYQDASLIGVTAALALDLPVWGVNLRRAQLARPIQRSVTTEAFHVRPGEVIGVQTPVGMVPPVADILVQIAMDAGAIAAVCTADAALNKQMLSVEDLATSAELLGTWPRSAHARAMVRQVDGRSESVGESRLRLGLSSLGVVLEPQVVIRDEHGDVLGRVDFVVAGTRIVIEFDGAIKYAEGGADALVREKRREDQIRSQGYTVIRVTWPELNNIRLIKRRIDHAVTQSARWAS